MKSFTDKVPLRDSTCWAGFRKAEWIPHRYGSCGGRLIQYSADRKTFVWADHPVEGIDAVLQDGLPITAWVPRNALDSTGRAIAFVDFVETIPEGVELVARGRAKQHPVRGGRMENAADILADLLGPIAGLDVPEARLAAFRAQCAGLPVGGSIDDGTRSILSVAREIADSVYAILAPDMIGLAKFADVPGPAMLTITSKHKASCNVGRDGRVNDLTVRYGFEAGEPRGACQFEAPDSVAKIGRQPAVIDAMWIQSARTASLVADRRIKQSARPQWVTQVSGIPGQVRIGQSVAVSHPVLPFTTTCLVTSREYSSSEAGPDGQSSITFRAPVGAVPRTRLLRNSVAFDANAPAAPATNITNDVFEVQILDVTGTALPGASCTLDDVCTRFADSAGVVSFPRYLATPGSHTIIAIPNDGRPPLPPIIIVVPAA